MITVLSYQGLCGTFNGNQQDDLLTPENDIEKSVTAFASKWRSNEKCDAEKETYDGSNACEISVQNKPLAEQYCQNLTGSIFEGRYTRTVYVICRDYILCTCRPTAHL